MLQNGFVYFFILNRYTDINSPTVAYKHVLCYSFILNVLKCAIHYYYNNDNIGNLGEKQQIDFAHINALNTFSLKDNYCKIGTKIERHDT